MPTEQDVMAAYARGWNAGHAAGYDEGWDAATAEARRKLGLDRPHPDNSRGTRKADDDA